VRQIAQQLLTGMAAALTVAFLLVSPASAHTGDDPGPNYEWNDTTGKFGNPHFTVFLESGVPQIHWDFDWTGSTEFHAEIGQCCGFPPLTNVYHAETPEGDFSYCVGVNELDGDGDPDGGWVSLGCHGHGSHFGVDPAGPESHRNYSSVSLAWPDTDGYILEICQGDPCESVAEATTAATPPAVVETTLEVDSYGSSFIKIAWTVEGGTAESFVVQRSPDGVEWDEVATRPGEASSYRDDGLREGVTFSYRVAGVRDGEPDDWSNEVMATTSEPTNDDTADPGSDDGDGNEVSCGFNMFCWIKAALRWAFIPGEATSTAWATLRTTAESRPPYSLVTGSLAFVSNVTGWGGWSGENTYYLCPFKGRPEYSTLPNPSNTIDGIDCMDDPMDEVAESAAFGYLRQTVRLGLWGAFAFGMWRKVRGGVGDNTQPDPGSDEA